MCSGKDRPQVLHLNPGVESRRFDEVVPEELLDVTDVGSSAKKVRGAGVPERVRINAVWDTGKLAVASQHSVDEALTHSASAQGKEESPLGRVVEQTRPSLLEVEIHRSGSSSWYR